jgi:hypothetical protein
MFCEEAVLMYRSGIFNSLSRKKSEEHMVSAFNSLHLGVDKILSIKNDARSRLACANTCQNWNYHFYPLHKELSFKTDLRIKSLGGSTIHIGGGKVYVLFARLFGWKTAKKLKLFLRGLR